MKNKLIIGFCFVVGFSFIIHAQRQDIRRGGSGGSGSATNLTPWASDINGAAFALTNASYISLNGKTNRVTDNGTNLTYNGTVIGTGSGTVGTVVNTVAPYAAGVPLVFNGTNTTNAVPGYGGEPVITNAGNATITYTNNNVFFIWNSATNCTITFNDGATNGFSVTFKNLGAGSLILTNNAGKTFDGISSVTLPTSTISHWIADGTNYRGGRGSPKNLNGPNTVFASPSDGSTGLMVPRALVTADLASGIIVATNLASGVVTSLQTNVAAANPTATATSSIQNGSATTFMRSDASPALPQGLSTTSSPTFNLLSAADVFIGGFSDSIGTLTHAGGNVVIDFSGTNRIWSCTITGNVTFVLTNATAAGRFARVILRNSQATNCTPTFNFPAGSITNFYGGAPSTLTAGTMGWLTYRTTDTTTNSTVAWYTETQ